jgi:hypothetical protein
MEVGRHGRWATNWRRSGCERSSCRSAPPTPSELAYFLADAEPALAVCDPARVGQLQAIAKTALVVRLDARGRGDDVAGLPEFRGGELCHGLSPIFGRRSEDVVDVVGRLQPNP